MREVNTISKVSVVMCQPNKYTFQDPKAFAFVNKYLKGSILNLCAGLTEFHKNEIRVNKDPKMPNLDYTGEVDDYLNDCVLTFDVIIVDTPWNERKAREKYEGRSIGSFQKLKPMIMARLKPGGIIITAGYDTRNFMKKGNGIKRIDLIVCEQPGDIKPFFIAVEMKINHSLEDWL